MVPNVGIIVGRKAVLVVDTGMGTRNAETVLREVAKVGAGKPIYIVTTHVHPEHDMGAHAFPKDSKLIRSKTQVEDIAAGTGMNLVPLFASRSDLNKELLKDAKHRDADIVFDEHVHARSRRPEGADPRPGHEPHARRYRDARRWRAVLGRCGHEAAAGVHQSHGDHHPLAREPRRARGHAAASSIVPSHGPFGGTSKSSRVTASISRASAIARPSSRRPARPRTKRSRSSPTRCPRSTRTRTGWPARSAQAIAEDGS